LRPRAVKEENRKAAGRQQNKQRNFPAVPEKTAAAFLFPRSETSEELHY
jgi:hypothetical protein